MPAPLPPTFAMTLPSSTSGDPAAPKKPLATLKRAAVSSLQSRVPVVSATAWSCPSAPNV